MSDRFTAAPRIAFGFILIAVSTVLHATPLLTLALLKFIVPLASVRAAISRALVLIAESWIAINSALIRSFARTHIDVEGLDGLRRDGRYLVICNHQSWVDIPFLQSIFNRRIPFLRFFLKSELIWVPVLGLAWWALDFPFMKRYPRELLEQRPELRGKDLEATRKACAKYRDLPVSVTNFVEGTRFTRAKHARQQSPYEHLLLPRAGGLAFVLEAMGEQLDAIIDVTLFYPHGKPDVLDLMAGRVREVRARVRRVAVPRGLLGGDYQNDAAFRERFQSWLNGLWADKDQCLAREAERASGAATAIAPAS